MSHQCPECGKPYKSKSGLRRHIKTKHTIDEAPTPDASEGVLDLMGEPSLEQALAELGIAEADVLSYRVYHDKVVIIEGPVGAKRVWCAGEE